MRRLFSVLTVLSLTLAPSPAAAGDAGEATSPRWPVCGEWRHVPLPLEDGQAPRGTVVDVEVVSPTDVWALVDRGYEIWNEAHIYRWRGLRWSEVAFPAPDTGRVASWSLSAIRAMPNGDVWVVGDRYRVGATHDWMASRVFAAVWRGGRWHRQLLDVKGTLHGVAPIPGSNGIVAVGWTSGPRSGNRPRTLALRWDGRTWNRIASPTPGVWSEFDAAVTVGSSLWAIGTMKRTGDPPRLLAARWTAEGWRTRVGPRGRYVALDGITPDRLWAVGSARRVRRQAPWDDSVGVIASWNGRRWGLVRRFDQVSGFDDVVAPSWRLTVATGNRAINGMGGSEPRIARRVGSRWRFDTVPARWGRMTAIDGTPHDLWSFRSFPPVKMAEVWSFTSYHRC